MIILNYYRRLFYYGKKKREIKRRKKKYNSKFIEEYDIQTAEDIQDALKDLLGGTIENMLKAELDNHLVFSAR